jgi:TolA-binding protein
MRKIFSISLMLTLCCAAALALAQEQQKTFGPSISEWLKGLQKKLEQIVPRESVPLSTGVAGVRGAREDSQPKLYWKGKKDDEAVTEEELTKFKSAVDAAEKGDRSGAIKELEEFMKQHPDSALIPDAKKTLDLVKAAGKEEKK